MARQRIQAGISTVVLLAILATVGFLTYKAYSASYTTVHNLAIGANVSVSGSKVPRNIKAVATTAQATLGAAFVPLGATAQITPAGTLPGPVTLRFKLNRQLGHDDVVLVASSELSQGPWTVVQPAISSDGWYASVQATHLSFWQVLGINPTALVKFLHGTLDGLDGNLTADATPPQCTGDWYNETPAQRAGYAVTSFSQAARSALYWCFGLENNQRILKIVNKLRYPLQVSHPGYTFIRDNGPLVSLDLDQLARLGVGPDTILYPFEEADYAVNVRPGQQVTISTRFSNVAEGLALFANAATVAIAIAAPFVKAVTTTTEVSVEVVQDGETSWVSISQTTRTVETESVLMKFMNKLLAAKNCLNGLLSTNIGQIVQGCLTGGQAFALFAVMFSPLPWIVGAVLAAALVALMVVGPILEFIRGFAQYATDSASIQYYYFYEVIVSLAQTAGSPPPISQPPTPVTPVPQPVTPVPQSQAVNAYDNYGQANLWGHSMCRGNPANSLSMPGGTGTQTFTVPAGVATISSAKIQIDPAPVTAQLQVAVNGVVEATTSAAAVGDTYFSFGPVSVHAGDTVELIITFSATSGKIITLYTVGYGVPGGVFTSRNTCPDGASNDTVTNGALRAVVYGMS